MDQKLPPELAELSPEELTRAIKNLPIGKKRPQALADLPIRQYEAWAYLKRTQAFKAFLAKQSEPADQEAALGAFLDTPEGELVAKKLGFSEAYEGPISNTGQIRPDGRTLVAVDLNCSTKALIEAFRKFLNKYGPKGRGKGRPDLEKI